jgi:hypothetical protein
MLKQLKFNSFLFCQRPSLRMACLLLGTSLITCHPRHHFSALATGSLTLDPSNLDSNLHFSGFDAYDLTQNDELQVQGVGKKQLKSVKLQNFTVRVAKPAFGQDLTFINSIDVYLSKDGQQGPLLAHGDSFEPTLVLVGLNVADEELLPYVNAAATAKLHFVVKANYNTSTGLSQSTNLEGSAVFDVTTTPAQTLCSN